MMTPERWDAAIETGKRNAEAIELAENWCAHLKVVADSSGGLLEAQSGLPTGMRHIECEHAPMGGMSAWEFRDIEVVSPVHASIVTSGAAPQTIARIRAAHIRFYGQSTKGMYRSAQRAAPYNLFVHLKEVAAVARPE